MSEEDYDIKILIFSGPTASLQQPHLSRDEHFWHFPSSMPSPLPAHTNPRKTCVVKNCISIPYPIPTHPTVIYCKTWMDIVRVTLIPTGVNSREYNLNGIRIVYFIIIFIIITNDYLRLRLLRGVSFLVWPVISV